MIKKSQIENLISQYLEGPKILEESISGMNKNEMMLRPISDKWTTLEVVCHISDMELVYADRIKRIIVEDKPVLSYADPYLFSFLYYHDREPEEEINFVYCIRNHIVKILEKLNEKQWERVGIHTKLGEVSLFQIVKDITFHIPHHVKFIYEKKKLIKKV